MGGKGALIQTDKSATLSTLQDQTLFQPVPYGIGSYHSNAWKSNNPSSGIYEADTAKTLDSLNCGYPGCNQGGMAVVQPILDDQGGSQISVRYDGKSPTLRAETHGNLPCVMAYSIENHPAGSRVDIDESGKVQTLTSRMGTGGGNVPMDLEQMPFCKSARAQSAEDATTWKHGEAANTLNAFDLGEARANELVVGVYCIGNGQVDQLGLSENVGTLNCMHDQQALLVPQIAHTLKAKASCDFREDSETYIVAGNDSCHNLNANNVVRVKHIVRRLTPLECERLQGYPDGWTDIGEWVDSKGKKHKEADSPSYKALGNSIAIPPLEVGAEEALCLL